MERRYFELTGASRLRQTNMQVGCILGFVKLLCIFQNECETRQEANVIVLE